MLAYLVTAALAMAIIAGFNVSNLIGSSFGVRLLLRLQTQLIRACLQATWVVTMFYDPRKRECQLCFAPALFVNRLQHLQLQLCVQLPLHLTQLR